ncbi:MAG TPA: hypothetical protein VFA04_19280 [Bryobacteraceae bacterium]|nr:hypothetical protein [Bryobacteraceae bacterium]
MSSLQQTCFVHASREAVALCIDCRHSFCRECVVDHDGRLICAACLGKLQRKPRQASRRWRSIASAAGLGAALILCWILFYMGGRALLMSEPRHHSFSSERP